MIIKSEIIKVVEKAEEKGTSKNTGKEYTNKIIYVEDKEGLNYRISFCNDLVYNKAQKEKKYNLKYYLATNGRIELNDIEEIK